MNREQSNNRAATPPRHELEDLYHEPSSFGEPPMFLVDEARLEEYFRLEQQLNNSDERLSSAGRLRGVTSGAQRNGIPQQRVIRFRAESLPPWLRKFWW
jgi:hypothetical protein